MRYNDFYKKSIENPEDFWAKQARQIQWFVEPKTILSQDGQGFYRWFEDGKMNTAYLALDYHIEQGRGDEVALIYDSPVTKTIKKYTYNELRDEVAKFAGGLRKLGVEKSDTVVVYMPMIPEAAIAMLAVARLGAAHSVVFGGFAPHELALRIDDARPKVLISASCGIEFERVIPYKNLLDQAIEEATYKPKHTIMYQRSMHKADLKREQEHTWAEVMDNAEAIDPVEVNATDPLYILYTSGTTGKPKGIVRDNGGHAVALKFSMKYIYNTNQGEVFWAASDVGWVVGHSYIVYGPLIAGATTVLFEGKPVRTPNAGTFWRIIEDHKVNTFFTAPTAFRAIRKEDSKGEYFKKYDTSSLKALFVAGERCDPATLNWLQDLLKVPVIDHWWQTESGWPMLANMLGVEELPIKVGSACKPVCGYDLRILNEEGRECLPEEEGSVVIKLPLPPGCLPTLWKDAQRFADSYLSTFEGYYLSGDGGYKDKDDYVFIMGRTDDVINVAGHRLSTGEMEEMVSAHPDVAECAVIGIADPLRGQVPVGLVVLKDKAEISEEALEQELVQKVRADLGAVACFRRNVVVKRLPKTRSGKILRKTLRKIADGEAFNIPSTIDDPQILDEIRTVFSSKRLGIAFGENAHVK